MTYLVKAACVLAKDQQGKIRYHYEGAVIPWLSSDQAKHFLDEGLVEKSGDAVDDGGDSDGPPAKAAPKADWVAWAVKASADTDEPLTEETAEEYSKADLVELYG